MYRSSILGALGLTACLGPQVEVSAERVAAQVAWVTDAVPVCASGDVPASGRRLLTGLVEVARLMREVENRKLLLKDGTFDYPGACGGGMRYDYEHGGGITTYDLHFEDYCAHSAGGVPNRLRGGVRGKEIGQSTPDGPMIRAFEFDGDLGVRFDDAPGELAQRTPWGGSGGDGGGASGGGRLPKAEGDFRVTVQGMRTDYGTPSTWSPDPPTAAAPNRTKVRRVRLEQDGVAETLEVRDLVWESVGDRAVEAHVREGKFVGRDGGWVAIRTAEDAPIRVDLASGEVVAGTIRLEGTRDSHAELRVDLGRGRFDVLVNGETSSSGLNCADAVPLLADVGIVLLSVMPELGR